VQRLILYNNNKGKVREAETGELDRGEKGCGRRRKEMRCKRRGKK
jgi:hypothetical protein